MKLADLRKHIIQNEIKEAFELANQLFTSHQNELQLLFAQYAAWQDQDLLNLGPPLEERNRIIYSFLKLISQIEQKQQTGLAAQKLKALAHLEYDISLAYGTLVELNKKTIIDLFMLWLINDYPEQLRQLIKEESATSHAWSVSRILSQLDLQKFINSHQLQISQEEISHLIHTNSMNFPLFFSDWKDYNEKRKKYSTDLRTELEKSKTQHHQIIATGFVSGIIGSISINLLNSKIQAIITKYNEDTPNSDDSDFNDFEIDD